MVVSNVITGVVNFFSFLSLYSTSSSETSFLGAGFILAASIFLEAMSLKNDYRHITSGIIILCKILLYLISIVGAVVSFAGLAGFVDVHFKGELPLHIMISSFPNAIYYFTPVDLGIFLIIFWGIGTGAPLLLAARENLLQKFRVTHYNLNDGLYGK